MRSQISKWMLIIMIVIAPLFAYAATPVWQIIPDESSITFKGVQNGAPASGKFKKFTGTIHFDPDDLNTSNVKIDIDMNSVSMSYADFTSALISEDWFNVKLFPNAIFEATHFTKIDNNLYKANGSLTIRDKSVPIEISFDAKEQPGNKVLVTGSTVVKRTQFGVGQGEWSDTDAIKDNVDVAFSVTAKRE